VRRSGWVLLAVTLLGVAGLPMPAAAECIGPWTPMPSFSAIARNAERVIIGTVIEDLESTAGGEEQGGITASFVLEVDAVLRGPEPGELLKMDLVGTGARRTGECGGTPTIFATVGDQIAVAFDGHLPGRLRPITAAAWVEGTPDELAAAKAEVLSIDEVRHATAPLPDTSTSDGESASPIDRLVRFMLKLIVRRPDV